MERTHRWAERCLKAHQRKDQALYAIVQGGLDIRLRRNSAKYLTTLNFPGYAIGGLSLGEPKQSTLEMVGKTTSALPEGKPRYLMGVGSPEDIVEAISRGCDVFDSALPTRVARNGAFFTRAGRFNISNAKYRLQEEPLENGCSCSVCTGYSAAYLHHLYRARELLVLRLLTLHNLNFIARLMESVRTAITQDEFGSFRDDFLAAYRPTDETSRLNQKEKWIFRHKEERE